MLPAAPAFLSLPPPPRTAIVILAALLFAALPMMFSLPPAITLLFVALLVFRGVLLHLNIGKLPAPVLIVMVAAAGGLVWVQLGTVFGREGGIAFLLLMVTLKAFESTTRRDWHVLLLSMLFLIGSSVLLNQSLAVGLWLLAALFAVSACFAVLGGLNLRESWRWSGMALLLTLPLAAVLFVSVPRLNEPLWGIPQQRDNQASTGLSDWCKATNGWRTWCFQTASLSSRKTYTGAPSLWMISTAAHGRLRQVSPKTMPKAFQTAKALTIK